MRIQNEKNTCLLSFGLWGLNLSTQTGLRLPQYKILTDFSEMSMMVVLCLFSKALRAWLTKISVRIKTSMPSGRVVRTLRCLAVRKHRFQCPDILILTILLKWNSF